MAAQLQNHENESKHINKLLKNIQVQPRCLAPQEYLKGKDIDKLEQSTYARAIFRSLEEAIGNLKRGLMCAESAMDIQDFCDFLIRIEILINSNNMELEFTHTLELDIEKIMEPITQNCIKLFIERSNFICNELDIRKFIRTPYLAVKKVK